MTPYGQAEMQYPQPLHTSSCTTTVPNSVRNSAPVGHTSRQAARVQCLHTSELMSHRKAPSQALQPIQIDVSVKNPTRGWSSGSTMAVTVTLRCGGRPPTPAVAVPGG